MENEKPSGALWIKTSKAGNEYFSGQIEVEGKKYYISAVKNQKATPENRQPSYNIYLKDEVKSKQKVLTPAPQQRGDEEQISLADIPF